MLRQLRENPASYHRVVTMQYTFDPLVNEYLRRTIGLEAVNRIYRDEVPAAFWTVRYFRDSQKEEYFIVLRPDGTLHSVHHTLAEAAPGANLTKEEAQARAEAFLRDSKKIDLSQWKLVEARSEKLPSRTDHSFVWEETQPLNPSPPGAEAAHVRISLAVQGDEVSGYRIFIHLPEDWVRKQNETTLANTAQTVLVALAHRRFWPRRIDHLSPKSEEPSNRGGPVEANCPLVAGGFGGFAAQVRQRSNRCTFSRIEPSSLLRRSLEALLIGQALERSAFLLGDHTPSGIGLRFF